MKFGGVGLSNMVCISLFCIVFIVLLKAVLSKHEVPFVTDIVQAV